MPPRRRRRDAAPADGGPFLATAGGANNAPRRESRESRPLLWGALFLALSVPPLAVSRLYSDSTGQSVAYLASEASLSDWDDPAFKTMGKDGTRGGGPRPSRRPHAPRRGTRSRVKTLSLNSAFRWRAAEKNSVTRLSAETRRKTLIGVNGTVSRSMAAAAIVADATEAAATGRGLRHWPSPWPRSWPQPWRGRDHGRGSGQPKSWLRLRLDEVWPRVVTPSHGPRSSTRSWSWS